ncbi:MAG: hypothetical protein II642_06505 [Firmicutes bacterium]|nr:hypothetical protein [Bacillota bacterium]
MPDNKKLVTKPKKKSPRPIENELLDAERRGGGPYQLKASRFGFEKEASFLTTGRFSKLPRHYDQHCTPTAFTNAIITLARRHGYSEVLAKTPEEIFETCAAIGRHALLYWNVKLFGRFGGTSAPLTELYLRLCLRRFKVKPTLLRGHYAGVPGTEASLRNALIRTLLKGHFAILTVLYHPIYGSHTVIAYGVDVVSGPSGKPVYYVKLADGWNERPRYLPVDKLRLFLFWELA